MSDIVVLVVVVDLKVRVVRCQNQWRKLLSDESRQAIWTVDRFTFPYKAYIDLPLDDCLANRALCGFGGVYIIKCQLQWSHIRNGEGCTALTTQPVIFTNYAGTIVFIRINGYTTNRAMGKGDVLLKSSVVVKGGAAFAQIPNRFLKADFCLRYLSIRDTIPMHK
jgi:hypothetical protein